MFYQTNTLQSPPSKASRLRSGHSCNSMRLTIDSNLSHYLHLIKTLCIYVEIGTRISPQQYAGSHYITSHLTDSKTLQIQKLFRLLFRPPGHQTVQQFPVKAGRTTTMDTLFISVFCTHICTVLTLLSSALIYFHLHCLLSAPLL